MRNLSLIVVLTDKNLEQQKILAAYEQLICSSEDMRALVDDHRNTIEFLQKEKTKAEASLECAAKKVTAAEKRSQSVSKKLDNLLVVVKSRVDPVGVFSNYLDNLKKKSFIYSPVEDDTVDVKLAEYLNSLPDSQALTELFSRESEGIYHFGTKRVFVKIENGKVISKYLYAI
eukprot:TRINITY_DN3156_c0_g1_i3.p1 TRINITY_DN3156_c0_g1~~TRINITY_DN3156_c0_g1_i3.p1  ORF type:complete len:173 (+),score=41.81 TRINITY_DN3156_c0_g1_i3:453-971(+)